MAFLAELGRAASAAPPGGMTATSNCTKNRTIGTPERGRPRVPWEAHGSVRFPGQGRGRKVRDRAMRCCKAKGVRLPTFAELAEPDADRRGRARRAWPRSAPTMPTRSTSIASTGSTTRARTAQVATPVHVELPEALTGVKARIVVALGALFPDDPRAQGAGGLRLPGAAPGVGALRSDAAARGVAVDRQLLPRRRRHLAHPGLPRRRRAAGGHEPGALRLARPMGDRARGHRAHARHRVQRQGDLRQVRRAGARSGQRDRQPVQRVRQLPGALALHRAGAGDASSWRCARRRRDLRLAGFVVGQRLGRHARRGRLPQGEARREDRRGRGRRVPDAAHERLRRAQHPGHRRQARAADPQRHEHRPRDRRQRPGDRRAQRRVQHRRRAATIWRGGSAWRRSWCARSAISACPRSPTSSAPSRWPSTASSGPTT